MILLIYLEVIKISESESNCKYLTCEDDTDDSCGFYYHAY